MPVIFHEQERAYANWRKRNPSGYVFNYFGGKDPKYNKIHRVNCWKLTSGQQGMRTSVKKVCCEELDDLKAYANVLRGGPEGWTYCKACLD